MKRSPGGETTFGERARAMGKVAELLKSDRNRYARMMAEEMGKPIRQGEAEITKCASVCDYYAENAERNRDSDFRSPVAHRADSATPGCIYSQCVHGLKADERTFVGKNYRTVCNAYR